MDLNVQMGQRQAKMRFLITDLGNEDLILRYPWLANFEPKFSWDKGAMDTSYLPVIVQSLDWESKLMKHTISQTIVTFGLHFTTQIHRTASFPFSLSLTLKPMYDTIWWIHSVQYNLVALFGPFCTISISEPHILRYLVLGELRSLST